MQFQPSQAMSGESTTKFACDYAKRGTAGCKKCKAKCEKGALRIAKVVPNFFHDGEGELSIMRNIALAVSILHGVLERVIYILVVLPFCLLL